MNRSQKTGTQWDELPLAVRRAICTDIDAARDTGSKVERLLIQNANKRLQDCEEDKRVAVLQECLDLAVVQLGVALGEMIRSEARILLAWLGSSAVTEARAEFVETLILEQCASIVDLYTKECGLRWLKGACDGAIITGEDRDRVEVARREWLRHTPEGWDGADGAHRNCFKTKCQLCGAPVWKLAFHLGGAEFDEPADHNSDWRRHPCYSDASRAVYEVLQHWQLPAWLAGDAHLDAHPKKAAKHQAVAKVETETGIVTVRKIEASAKHRAIRKIEAETGIAMNAVVKRELRSLREEIGVLVAGCPSADGSPRPNGDVGVSFAHWSPRQRFVGEYLDRCKGPANSDDIKRAMKGTDHEWKAMSQIFRNSGLLGLRNSNTPIVRLSDRVYCLRRYLHTQNT